MRRVARMVAEEAGTVAAVAGMAVVVAGMAAVGTVEVDITMVVIITAAVGGAAGGDLEW